MEGWTMFALGVASGLVLGLVVALQVLGRMMSALAPGFIQMVERKIDEEMAEARKHDEAFRQELSQKIAALGGRR